MIAVTRMNGDKIVLNADLIESVESRPDTLITLTTGNRIMVKETVLQVTERIKEYRMEISSGALSRMNERAGEETE
ncbi:MAG: flagellar FlbD family protein [Elusimicrobia bacterium]|nr:flagellar FlbD family protein [Elusimicrobiota bacterium]